LLSLENSLCDDYITEKFFNVLQNYNTVPVVMGPKKEVNIFSIVSTILKKRVPTRFLGSETHIPPQSWMGFGYYNALKNVTLFWCCYRTVDFATTASQNEFSFPLIRKPILFRK
jgi:hypothetical protein